MVCESRPKIRCQHVGHVAYLIIDHQIKHNALTFEMWESLPAILKAADTDPTIRLVVLQGAGQKAFSAGSDISQFGERRSTPEGIALYNSTVAEAVSSLRDVRKPVVARIQGYCTGAGLALALHCDLRYATDDATFGIPAGQLGLGYQHLWLQRLTWLAGPAKAKEIMFTAFRYDANAVSRMGLINQVSTDDEFAELVNTICEMAPLTLIASKMAIDQTMHPDRYDHCACQAAIHACFASQDYIEGRIAFGENRKPKFVGY